MGDQEPVEGDVRMVALDDCFLAVWYLSDSDFAATVRWVVLGRDGWAPVVGSFQACFDPCGGALWTLTRLIPADGALIVTWISQFGYSEVRMASSGGSIALAFRAANDEVRVRLYAVRLRGRPAGH
jgi:hypothetical protein